MSFRAGEFLIGLTAAITAPTLVSAQQAIFVIRHSDPPATLSFDEIRDETPLSQSGQQRAKALAGRLKDAGITAIFATQAKRTVETAEPLAKHLGVEVRVQSYHDTDGLIHRIRTEHGGGRVLVVGHWSTIPLILKALGDQQAIKIEPSEYDNLFVVIPNDDQRPVVLRLHY